MEHKKCFKCNKIKPLSDFYKHPQMSDGYLNKCKECTKKDTNEYRNNNIEKCREYDRERGHLEYRKEANRKRPVDKNKRREYIRNYRKKYPKKTRAVRILNYNLRKGYIKKLPCEICGCLKVHAHHDDYNFPLNVRWLCIKHHSELHTKINEKNRNGKRKI